MQLWTRRQKVAAMSEAIEPKPAILLVCLGNICRSPMAEGALRDAANIAGLNITVDSAGTAGYHIGESPDPRAIATALRHGVDISGASGRKLSEEDFYNFTHIFAFDKANLAGIKARQPRHGMARVALLLDVLDDSKGKPVPDPYYGDDSDFEDCWIMVKEAIDALVANLSQESDKPAT